MNANKKYEWWNAYVCVNYQNTNYKKWLNLSSYKNNYWDSFSELKWKRAKKKKMKGVLLFFDFQIPQMFHMWITQMQTLTSFTLSFIFLSAKLVTNTTNKSKSFKTLTNSDDSEILSMITIYNNKKPINLKIICFRLFFIVKNKNILSILAVSVK